MLPAFKTILIPPLEVRVDSRDMAALAAGWWGRSSAG